MNAFVIVGVAGARGAGKDTVAQRLVEKWGFRRIGVADALKYEVSRRLRRTLLEYLALRRGDRVWDEPVEQQEALVHHLLHVEKPALVRRLLQEYGTEVRRADDPDYWVSQWASRVLAVTDADRIVTPDVRFPNEVAAIRSCPGTGLVVYVVRPGYEGDDHPSERSLDAEITWDHRFVNHGTVDALHADVDEWADRVIGSAIS